MSGHPPRLGDEDSTDPSRFRQRLQGIYRDLDAEIARLAPVCSLSGRCCKFEEYGHTLFVSAPEFDLLLADAPTPSRPLDGGATCPWQDLNNRCTARDARPLGCRVYFCDPAYEPLAPDLTEAFLARIKAMVIEMGLPWNYAPLHRHLDEAVRSGLMGTPRSESLEADSLGSENPIASRH
ncbi:hypothetical protein EP7_003614 [Isosphaeraceae bacterium EP7]